MPGNTLEQQRIAELESAVRRLESETRRLSLDLRMATSDLKFFATVAWVLAMAAVVRGGLRT